MRKLLSFVCAQSVFGAFAAPRVSDVKVAKKSWGYEIAYRVSDATEADAKTQRLEVSVKVGGVWKAAKSLIGDVRCENGVRRVTWMAEQDGVRLSQAGRAVSVRFREIAYRYCVIDLSGGADARSYPVAYLEKEPKGGFNTVEHKTKKLVLKRVEPGSFVMGERQMDDSCRVTLTKPFYMGLFEVTQGQWERVMGTNPSKFAGEPSNPVEQVSYDMIRGSGLGAKWPESNEVDSASFLGRLRTKTMVDFDLPTEAQWEYACRAGTTTRFSYGDKEDGAYMWFKENSDENTHAVGTKKPNPWGLYDMHGNVWEWCLDWHYKVLLYGEDPKGVSSGSNRIIRGGSWASPEGRFTSFHRGFDRPSLNAHHFGFRLCLPPRMEREAVKDDGEGDEPKDAEADAKKGEEAELGKATPVKSGKAYCVVDLAGAKFKVTYLDNPPKDGFNTVEYKTKKLVLKRVESGSFVMGPNQGDDSRRVTLTKPFYMGLYEVTQKQWELVTKENPSAVNGETRPVDNVSYVMIRGTGLGAKWSASGDVDKTSFLGKLRMKSGIAFDLPTEAQWEYACRAGTTTSFSHGDKANVDYMWYNENSADRTREVGMLKPNPWGFYDMHGNVWEWCLDWFWNLAYGEDPKGGATGTERILRGGGCLEGGGTCSSVARKSVNPPDHGSVFGLRLCAPAQ